jgi:hypothetical protein
MNVKTIDERRTGKNAFEKKYLCPILEHIFPLFIFYSLAVYEK